MRIARKPLLLTLSGLAVLSMVIAAFAAFHASGAHAATAAGTRSIASAGTTSPQTGDFSPSGSGDVTQDEFANGPADAAGPAAYPGTIVDRSNSQGTGNGVSVTSGQKAKSNPQFNAG